MEDPVVALERNLYGHLFFKRTIYGKGNLGKFFWNTGGKKLQIGTAYSSTEKKDLSVYVDDIKLAGKKRNVNPTWRVL